MLNHYYLKIQNKLQTNPVLFTIQERKDSFFKLYICNHIRAIEQQILMVSAKNQQAISRIDG